MTKSNLTVSIIIPVHNELELINKSLQRLKSQNNNILKEIIVVDSNGETIKVVNPKLINWYKLLLLQGKLKGRASQMNFGALKATGDILLFLHSDCFLPKNGLELIANLMNDESISVGAFDSDYDTKKIYLKLYVKIASWWARLIKNPLGDQGIFVRRDIFKKINGYNNILIFEEFDFISRLKKNGSKLKFLQATIIADSRRFDDCFICQALKNRLLTMMYYLGFDTKLLVKIYNFKFSR